MDAARHSRRQRRGRRSGTVCPPFRVSTWETPPTAARPATALGRNSSRPRNFAHCSPESSNFYTMIYFSIPNRPPRPKRAVLKGRRPGILIARAEASLRAQARDKRSKKLPLILARSAASPRLSRRSFSVGGSISGSLSGPQPLTILIHQNQHRRVLGRLHHVLISLPSVNLPFLSVLILSICGKKIPASFVSISVHPLAAFYAVVNSCPAFQSRYDSPSKPPYGRIN